MLTRTFCHIPGVGGSTERSLWRQGCDSWDAFLARSDDYRIGNTSRDILRGGVDASKQALAEGRHQFFAKTLGTREAWRAWPEFRDSCCYVDIETDGGQAGDAVTVIGLYNGKDFHAFLKGEDLGEFVDRISHYSMIVTFFGGGFDIPMIKKCFPGLHMDQIHLDLCPALKRVGFRGGLKKIEKQLGINRGESDGLNGYDAILMWRRWLRGDRKALDLLVEYNREDVVNLERLAEVGYERLRAQALALDPSGMSDR